VNPPRPEFCRVVGCRRIADTYWTPMMAGRPDVPVCRFHLRSNLWWYRGAVSGQ